MADKRVKFEEAVEVKLEVETLDETIALLKLAESKGKNVYTIFAGKKLYSMFDSEDTCYKKVTGKAKIDFVRDARLARERSEKNKKLTIASITRDKKPSIMERGNKLIYPEVKNSWNKCVESAITEEFGALDIETALDIMEALNEGKVNEANRMVNSERLTEEERASVLNIVAAYSKVGPAFYRANVKDIDEETEKTLKRLEKDNIKFAKNEKERNEGKIF